MVQLWAWMIKAYESGLHKLGEEVLSTLPGFFMAEWRQWRHGFCFIDMNHEIKLPRQGCVEIVFHAIDFRPVNDADSPMQSLVSEHVGRVAFSSQVEEEALPLKPRENFFITVGQRFSDWLRFRWSIPV